MEPTVDPGVIIEDRGDGYVVYRSTSGERWVVRGWCICCGECVVGSNDPNIVWTGLPLGWPLAAYDSEYGSPSRLDVPMRPDPRWREKNPHCTLEPEFLDK